MFVSEDKRSYICVYVIDLLLIGPDDDYLRSLKERLFKRFKIRLTVESGFDTNFWSRLDFRVEKNGPDSTRSVYSKWPI